MTKNLWLIFIFGLSASLIWWPGAKNEATIRQLIQQERLWQEKHLGVDLVEVVDEQLRAIQLIAFNVSFLKDEQSNIPYTRSLGEEDFRLATQRVTEKPYFQALFALLVLSLGRLIVTVLLFALLLPFFIAAIIDGLVERKVKGRELNPPDPYRFRIACAALTIAIEGLFLVSLIPLWITPTVIPSFFLGIAYVGYALTRHHYS